MVNGFPVPTNVPPQLEVYQATCNPEPPVVLKSIVPASSEQKLVLSVLADVGDAGEAITVIVFVAVNCPVQFDGATPVEVILNVVVVEIAPVGKLIIPPVPATGEPIFVIPFRNW